MTRVYPLLTKDRYSKNTAMTTKKRAVFSGRPLMKSYLLFMICGKLFCQFAHSVSGCRHKSAAFHACDFYHNQTCNAFRPRFQESFTATAVKPMITFFGVLYFHQLLHHIPCSVIIRLQYRQLSCNAVYSNQINIFQEENHGRRKQQGCH